MTNEAENDFVWETRAAILRWAVGGYLEKRFCKLFFESSTDVLQLS